MNLTPAEYQKLTKRGIQKLPRATKLPQPLSEGEETLAWHLKVELIPFEREVRFAKPRRWRFDFVIKHPTLKLAVEVDGGTANGKGRHSRGKGFERDVEKLNTAATMGWLVLRFSTAQVMQGFAINTIKHVIGRP